MGSKYGRSYTDLSYAELYILRSMLEKIEPSQSDAIKSFIVIAKEEYNLSYQAISDLLGEHGISKTRQSIYQIAKSINIISEPRAEIVFRGDSLEDMVVHLRCLGYTQMEIANIVKDFDGKSFDYEYRLVRGICNRYAVDIDSVYNRYTEELINEISLMEDFRLKDGDNIREKISYNEHIIKEKEFDIMLGRAYSKIFKDEIRDRVRCIRQIFGDTALESVYYTVLKEVSYKEILRLSNEGDSELNLDELNR